MGYTPVHADWKNDPDHTTPIDDTALEHIENGLVTTSDTADAALPKTGGTVTGPVLHQSTAAGGFFTSDSTSRVTVESYQTNDTTTFYAEGIRLDLMRGIAKNMIAWRLPRPPTGTDPATLRTVTWVGAHYYAQDQPDINNPTVVHGHWSVEVPDSADALRTRLEIKFVDESNNLGVDKTIVQVNHADLVVDCNPVAANPPGRLRLHGASGVERAIEFGGSQYTSPRWRILCNNTTESGTLVGSDLEIKRFDTSGNAQGSPLKVTRSTGRVLIGDTDGTQTGLDVNNNGSTQSVLTTTTATAGIGYAYKAADTTSRIIQGALTADPSNRLVVFADGKHEWGDGTNARDTNLYRTSAGVLKTDNSINIAGNLTVAGTSPLPSITQPEDHGLLVWTYDPVFASSNSTLTNGTVYLIGIYVRRSLTISKVWWAHSTAGATPTSTQNVAGLYSSVGSLLSSVNIDAKVTNGNAAQNATLTAPQVVTPGLYWIGLVFNATTAPTLLRTNGALQGLNNVNLTTSTKRFATNSTTQTTLPSSVTPASNADTFAFWGAVS